MWNFLLILPEMDSKNPQPCTSSDLYSPRTVEAMNLRIASSNYPGNNDNDGANEIEHGAGASAADGGGDDDDGNGGGNGQRDDRSECDSLSEIIVSLRNSWSCRIFFLL